MRTAWSKHTQNLSLSRVIGSQSFQPRAATRLMPSRCWDAVLLRGPAKALEAVPCSHGAQEAFERGVGKGGGGVTKALGAPAEPTK